MVGGEIVYRIDGEDRIVFVNDEWDRFALANGGGELGSLFILDRSLWEFVSDPGTRDIYLEAVRRVRHGRALHFSFRCDSPDCRRLLEMNMSYLDNRQVEFRTQTLSVEPRQTQELLDSRFPRCGDFLRVCGWCKKALVQDKWIELEEAFDCLRLHEQLTLPEITHGLCGTCLENMSRSLAEGNVDSGPAD
jgi:hypothetical protein